MWKACLFILVIAAHVPALAQQSTPPEPCGTVSEEGNCQGETAVFCDKGSNQLVKIECNKLPTSNAASAGGKCREINGFGAWCAVQDGDTCAFQGQAGSTLFACINADSGCNLASGTCVAKAGTCTPPAANTDGSSTCDDGNTISTCFPWGQKGFFGCADLTQDNNNTAQCTIFANQLNNGSPLASCAMDDGQTCFIPATANTSSQILDCKNPQSGCLDGSCKANLGTCDPTRENRPTCLDASTLQLECSAVGQPFALSCNQVGASSTCEGDHCIHLVAGETCFPGVYDCDAGLTCSQADPQQLGTCQPGNAANAANVAAADAPDAKKAKLSCCSTSLDGCLLGSGLLALLSAASRRRQPIRTT